MKVYDVMISPVVSISDQATYKEALEVLKTANVSGGPVIDSSGKVVGMISDKDLFRVLFPRYRSFYEKPEDYLDYESRENKIKEVALHPIIDFMEKDIVLVEHDTPIMKAGALMLARGIHRIPVVADGELVGIITRSEIFKRVISD